MKGFRHSSDLALAGFLASALAAMVIPFPTWLLDFGLALNLAASVALLVAAMFAKHALKVAAFPTLLLLTTLLRLGLNISSTRLALGEGYAGEVIAAFGEFVVGGNYLVGVVIFGILAIIQLLVVAKGAERVAEVSARFTLDALPGKQMSIDADLRSGAIDQSEARNKRRVLERESQMFGAMDGAMKFVKGDAIAGLVIVAVNLLGGTAVGVLQWQMPLKEAFENYALIAIGDGLVSQIPSLCTAVAAGLVVTRVASDEAELSIGGDIARQFLGQPLPLSVVGALCAALGCVPGIPLVPFMVLSGAAFVGSWAVFRRGFKDGTSAEGGQNVGSAGTTVAPSPQDTPLGVATVAIELSVGLSDLASKDEGRLPGQFLPEVRRQIFLELGVPVPMIQLRTQAAHLLDDQYAILLEEIPSGRGSLRTQRICALAAPAELAFLAEEAEGGIHPVTGGPVAWVHDSARPRLDAAGIQVLGPSELLCHHVRQVLLRKAALFLGIQEVQAILEAAEAQSPALVKEASGKVPLALLAEVLRRLVSEEVSVRNMRAILEALVSPSTEGDAAALTERCRAGLQRYLSHKYAPKGPLHAYLLDPAVEELLRSHPDQMEPVQISEILNSVRRAVRGGTALILAAPEVRRSMRRLCEGAFPEVAVLSFAELEPTVQVRPLGKIEMRLNGGALLAGAR